MANYCGKKQKASRYQ